MTWSYEPERLAAILEDAGFDVDRSAMRLDRAGGSLVGRREAPGSGLIVAINAGGRVRVTRTASLGPPEVATERVGGVALRRIAQETRQETSTGTVDSAEQFASLLDAILGEDRAKPGDDGTGGPW